VYSVAQVMTRTEDVLDTKQEVPEPMWTLWGREKSFASAGKQINLFWTKWHWGRYSPSISVSLASSHSTDCPTLIIYHPGLVQ
jgi:hypothetical protein